MRDIKSTIDDLLQRMREFGLARRSLELVPVIDGLFEGASPELARELTGCRSVVTWHVAAMEGRYDEGLDEAIRYIEHLKHAGFERRIDWLRHVAGFAIGIVGDLETGMQWIRKGVAAARVEGEQTILLAALSNLAALYGMAREYAEADATFQEADAVAPGQGRDRAHMLNNWAFARIIWARSLPEGSGERQALAARALACAEEAVALVTDAPENVRWLAWALANRAHALALLGRWEDAEQAYRASIPLAAVNYRIEVVAMAGYARLLAETARYEEGRKLLETAYAKVPSSLLDMPLDLVVETRAFLELKAGCVDEAMHWSDQRFRRLDAQYRVRLRHAFRQADLLTTIESERTAEREKAEVALRRAQAALAHAEVTRDVAAGHDILTALPGRKMVQARLQQSIDRIRLDGGSLVVLSVDIDNFKYVNDRYGHAVGDELLKAAAVRLWYCMCADDTLSRLAGDEFMLVLSNVNDRHQVTQVCDRLQARLAQPFELAGHQVVISVSIGAAIFPRTAEAKVDAETLMGFAETALIEAKKIGHNRHVVFEPQMSARRLAYVETRDALREALERGELELHYQPQVDLRTGSPVGMEALFRWRRPDGTLVAPGHFIGAAEDSGLIVPIGQWALREACRQAAAWHATHGLGLAVAVNLSAAHFSLGDVERDVDAALESSGLDPSSLEVELTESMLMEDDEGVERVLCALKQRGVRVLIDDFGTGYSNLGYLKRFQVDKLKIDRSFVAGLLEDERDRSIVQAMIDIARGLRIATLAEGVEDAAVAQVLADMGCDEAQGYLYARPLSAAEMDAWLGARRVA